MPIFIGNDISPVEVDSSTGNTTITPTTGGNIQLQDDIQGIQLTVSQTGVNISNDLSITGTASVGGSTVLTSANTPVLDEINDFTGTTNTFVNATVNGTLTASTDGLTNSADKNLITDADAAKISNLPNDISNDLSLKANISAQNFTGIVQADKLGVTGQSAEQAIAIGNAGVTDAGRTGIAFRTGTTTDARTGNYRAQIAYNYDNSKLQIRVGNNSNVATLNTVIEIDSGGQVTVGGSPVLTEATNPVGDAVEIINTGSGNALHFESTAADTNQKKYKFIPAASEKLLLRSLTDAGGTVKEWQFSHDGTTNFPEPVTVQNRQVLEEGNWALIQTAVNYDSTMPSLSNVDKVAWSGRHITFTSVGAVSFDLPEVVTGSPTASQIKVGEIMHFHNFNGTANVTISAESTQKVVNGDITNVSGTGGSLTLSAGHSAIFIASDLSGNSNVNTMGWLIRTII